MQKGGRNSSRSLEPDRFGSDSNPGAILICFIVQLVGAPRVRLHGLEPCLCVLMNRPAL